MGLRQEVLDWFEQLPIGERRATTTATQVRHEAARERRVLETREFRSQRGYTPRSPR